MFKCDRCDKTSILTENPILFTSVESIQKKADAINRPSAVSFTENSWEICGMCTDLFFTFMEGKCQSELSKT